MGDLCGARFALKRSNGRAAASQVPTLAILQQVLQSLWDHQYPAALQTLGSVAGLDPFTGLLRDAILLQAVWRAASSSPRNDNFSIAASVDVVALNASVSTIENLVNRAGGLDAVGRQVQVRGNAAVGWKLSNRTEQLQKASAALQEECS